MPTIKGYIIPKGVTVDVTYNNGNGQSAFHPGHVTQQENLFEDKDIWLRHEMSGTIVFKQGDWRIEVSKSDLKLDIR